MHVPQLRVRLFGQPHFDVGDTPFRFVARPKTLPMLVYLLLHRDRAISRDSLAFLLWEDEPEDQARVNLRRHIHHLHQALPDADVPWLEVNSETVRWNPEASFWLDIAEFEGLASIGKRREAIELYSGDLASSLYDEWLFEPRERLREHYLSMLLELVLECRASRQFAEAAAFAQRILTVDSWREDVLRQLMAIRYEAGDRAGALQLFEQFKRQLREEMNVVPMPETIALRDAVLADVALEDMPPVSARQGSFPIVRHALAFGGRAHEFERLRAELNRAAHGRGGLLLIAGEPGIGKTRLVTEFALRAESQGTRVLWGASTYPESAPYQPIVEGLRGVLGLVAALEIDPVWSAVLATLLPELRDRRPELANVAAVDPASERTRLFEALSLCLNALAEPRPVLFVLEDLHWAGPATIAALEYLTRRIAAHRVLCIGTYRDEQAPAALRSLRRRMQQENSLSHLALGRLEAQDIAAIVAQITELAGTNDIARRLFEASEGNPLFLGELIRDVVESEQSALASTLQNVISLRVARLSEAARFLLELGSVLGPAFDVDLMREVSGWDEAQVLQGIDELIARHLIREAGYGMHFDFAFTHHLIASAVYAGTPDDTRRRWHRRAARAAEGLYVTQTSEYAGFIARHFEASGDVEEAVSYYGRAAQAAFNIFAYDEVLTYARCGLDLRSGTPAEKFELTALCEASNSRLGNRQEQRGDLEALTTLAADLEDRDRTCEVLLRRIAFHRAIAEHEAEAADISTLYREGTGSVRWIASATESEGMLKENAGLLTEAYELAERAVQLYEATGDHRGLVFSLTFRAHVASYLGKQEEAKACILQSRSIAAASNDVTLQLRTLRYEKNIMLYTQDWAQYLRVAAEALSLARSTGDRDTEANCHHALGTAGFVLGNISEARDHLTKAMELQRKIGMRQALGTTLVNAAALEVEAGMLDKAEGFVDELERIARETGWQNGFEYCADKRFDIAQRRGDFARAETYAREGLAYARARKSQRSEAVALRQLGSASRELGHSAKAIEHLRQSEKLFTGLGAREDAVESASELAIALLADGQTDSARAVADRIVAECDSGAALRLAVATTALWAAARVFYASGDQTRATETLRRAAASLERRIASYPDDESREACRTLPDHLALSRAHARNEWPAIRVATALRR